MESGPKVVEQVVSSLLKRKIDENEGNNATLSLTQSRGGQCLQVTVGREKKTNTFGGSLLSASDFLKIQSWFHLSQREVLGIAQAFRVATRNSKLIEPRLKKKYQRKVTVWIYFLKLKILISSI